MVFQDMNRTTLHADFFLTDMTVTSSGSTAQVLLGCTKGTTAVIANTTQQCIEQLFPPNTEEQTLYVR